MYVHALIALGITLLLAYGLAWTRHHRYELTHLTLALLSIPTIVWLSVWCGQ